MVDSTRQAPYPADTRAKGWRFELDMERARQSDTWALAPADVRPWLLMLWATAWEQTPCGSMPDDDDLIAAKIGMPLKAFTKHKGVLLRRWWKADDGRLYHDVLVQRATEMVAARDKTAQRVAKYKLLRSAERATNALPTGDYGVKNGTGTGTGSKPSTEVGEVRDPPAPAEGETLPDPAGHEPTEAGAACKAIRLAGVADVNPSHPDLQRLLAAGVTATVLADTAKVIVAKGKPSFAYLLRTVEGQRIDAAAKAPVPAEAPKASTTVASDSADKTAEYLQQQTERNAMATKPNQAILALARRAVRTAP